MKKFAFLISFFSCLLLSSCNSLNDEVVVVPNPEEPSEPDEPTNPDTPVEEDLYEEMYDPTSNLQITLNFTNEAIFFNELGNKISLKTIIKQLNITINDFKIKLINTIPLIYLKTYKGKTKNL